jgi:endonuclease/exonuclease/phosphatase family metal-dependent hydrolase
VPVTIGTWNLEWFADPDGGTLGPTNNALQQMNVQTVLQQRTDVDLWGIQEVVGTSEFSMVAANLPGFQLVLATDLQAGTFYYGFAEQKVALLWRTSKFTLVSARLILTQDSFSFGGRPPIEALLRLSANGVTKDLYVIVLHMKAYADQASYDRRVAASAALKAYLETTRPADNVLVIGDWNDDLDRSTYMNSASPYANFVADPTRYRFPTKELTDANRRTTASSSQPIDHQLLTAPLFPHYLAGSTTATVPMIPGYTTTTSDHYPVTTRHVFR